MKKIIIITLAIFLCSTSVALGYYFGSSNMIGLYPSFNEYLPYNPSREDVERYLEKAKEYTSNYDNDIKTIRYEQNNAISKAQSAVNSYSLYR